MTDIPPITSSTPEKRRASPGSRFLLKFPVALLAFAVLLPGTASAKEIFDFFGGRGTLGGKFGSTPGGVAVNSSGNGPANAGDVYATDPTNNRIERFGVDDKGTPSAKDDTYFFISAWGADVSSPAGGSDYEVCTVADQCKAAAASGGNGDAAGNGSLNAPKGIAIDQDTGRIYVSDAGNNRVNVYEGDGVFVRSFGYDVVKSGPGHVSAPSEKQRLTVKANGGKFSLSFAGTATGPRGTAGRVVGLTTLTQVVATEGTFAVGQGVSGAGIAPGTTITGIGAETLTVSKPFIADTVSYEPLFGENFTHDASAAEVEAALNALPTIGGVGGSVTVTGGPGDETGSIPYVLEFGGTLAEEGVPPIVVSAGGMTIGSGTPSGSIQTLTEGGAYEVCVAAAGDVCEAGSVGAGAGQIGEASILDLNPSKAPSIAVSSPDASAASGSVFLADSGNRRVNTYDLDGADPSSFGSAAVFDQPDDHHDDPVSVAVDSRGILYATNSYGGPTSEQEVSIERYDTQNANGGGVGFLAPISPGVNERQEISIAATAGTFRLTFNGQTTGDIPFNATDREMEDALKDLSSVGSAGLRVSGGPGNASGSNSYLLTFDDWLGAKDVPQIAVSNGTTPLSGGAGATVKTAKAGQAGMARGTEVQLSVDPDTDGGGPDADVLYAKQDGRGAIQQFGPLNSPGLTTPPALDDERHSTRDVTDGEQGIAIESTSGRLFIAASGRAGNGIYLTGEAGPPPTGSFDLVDGVGANTATVHATIDPNGPPDTSYHFEYSTNGASWKSTPTILLGRQEDPQTIEETIEPGLFGLEPSTLYHVRLVYQRLFSDAVTTPELTFTTDPVGPLAETTGAPLRSTTTVQANGRVAPRNTTTTFHFEYGTQGPCDANPCTSTPDRSVGSGSSFELVAERIEGLEPNTTYHYRVVASNGVGAPVAGEDMTVTTLASEAPLSHGHFPGPPGSDRAWEMVSLADSGGNPVSAQRFSIDGNRAIYSVTGGTPISDSGSPAGQYFAERTPSGWHSAVITPSRGQLIGPDWIQTQAADDLSRLASINRKFGDERQAIWRYGPGVQPAKLFQDLPPQELEQTFLQASEDASVVAATIKGGALDPAYPAAAARANVYDVGAGGDPRLISLLPGETVASCGTAANSLSRDGRLLFFSSRGGGPCDETTSTQLYLRDLQAAETKLISGPALSGPDCSADFAKAIPGAAFFWTQTRLAVEDTAPANCSTSSSAEDGDVYRYDTGDGSLQCVTCLVTGSADVTLGTSSATNQVGIAEDGSRVYFRSIHGLVAGTSGGVYRINLATGNLAYAGPLDANLGPLLNDANPDGSVLLFDSESASLNPLGTATDNGVTRQVYRYDDADHSLVCISCPLDGDAPEGSVAFAGFGSSSAFLDDDGGVIAFSTPTPLISADQNTVGSGQVLEAGEDVYEWRGGRLLMITDGLTNWPAEGAPRVRSVSPSGRDIFFEAWAQYTPDALDAYRRIYDARLGGGFTYPKAPPPCPLEVCQGTPKGAPEEQAPGTGTFAGLGNRGSTPASCRKGKVRRKGRCVARRPKARQHKRQHRTANSNGRAHR